MSQLVSHGVEQLIDKLKNDGVNAGKDRADKLINNAHKQASIIINAAMSDAEKIRNEAKQAAEIELAAGKNDLNLAARDMVLEFRDNMTEKFKQETKRLVSDCVQSKETIYKLLMLICSNSLQELGDIEVKDAEIFVADQDIDLEAIKNNPDSVANDRLKDLVLNISARMLQKGISFGTFDDNAKGIYVKVDDGNVIVDFTDTALTAALLKHLQPRFRALLEGLLHR